MGIKVWPLRAAALLVALPLLFRCGSAQNTPEEAFLALRTALEQQRWDLLYQVVPPKLQEGFDAQVEENDLRIKSLVEQDPRLANELLQRDVGITYQQWGEMNNVERFAAVFDSQAKMELARLGVNSDYVIESEVKSVEIRGDKATIAIDDGKGHRNRLIFILVDDYWRYDLGEDG